MPNKSQHNFFGLKVSSSNKHNSDDMFCKLSKISSYCDAMDVKMSHNNSLKMENRAESHKICSISIKMDTAKLPEPWRYNSMPGRRNQLWVRFEECFNPGSIYEFTQKRRSNITRILQNWCCYNQLTYVT